MSEDIKVLLVDDIKQILDYFSAVINNESGMKVIGTASTGAEAVIQAEKLRPDIILMDIQMETDTDGIDAIEIISKKFPDIKCIVLTVHGDDENILNAFVAGATDFLVKTASIVEVLTVIRETINESNTRSVIAQKVKDEMVKLRKERNSLFYVANLISRLTVSEFEVLKAVYNGDTYKEIAKKRVIEESTVRSFVNKILKKLEAKSMRELIDNLKELKVIEYIDM